MKMIPTRLEILAIASFILGMICGIAPVILATLQIREAREVLIEVQLDHDETREELLECREVEEHLWERFTDCMALRGELCTTPGCWTPDDHPLDRWWELPTTENP